MKSLKNIYKKLRGLLLMSWYVLFFYHFGVKEHLVLIDSKNGKDLGSNLLRIAEELTHNPDYSQYHVYISCNKDKKADVKKMLSVYGLKGAILVTESGFRYTSVLATAKFLFTDTSFPMWFAKREGQVITNTWHGTPLKMMGKDVSNRAFDMGNVQKSYLVSDYLLYPSDYMKDIMVSAYYLDNLYQGKILCSGYPRNSIFFDKKQGEELRQKLGLSDKKLYGYMPTWRGVLKQNDSTKITNQLEYYFVYLDERLKDDEIFFVRLHPFVANTIDYSAYKHIKPFPQGYEPYDILNICDCMVTDYSSVLFDYANAGKKIILFVYDREFYMDERGAYVSIDSFPFPQVRRVKDLLTQLRSPMEYDDTEFRRIYCQYDGENVAARVCRHIVKGEKEFEEFTAKQNGKPNVILYASAFAKNGLTTALISLLEQVDKSKRNYFVTFRSTLLKSDPERVNIVPEGVGSIPIASISSPSLGEWWAIHQYYTENKTNSWIMKRVDRFYSRLYHRTYGHCRVDCAIQYCGYHKEIINMFLHAKARRVIFSHNDMVEELRTKTNHHKPTLVRAYKEYDEVAPVTVDIYEPTLKISGRSDNIVVVNNCHDYKAVLEKGTKELSFDKDTICNVFEDELREILSSDARKFITVGRFSPEKGHDMLIDAFNRYYEDHPNSYLIIIGGYGPIYEDTVSRAARSKAAKNIVIIKSISNPMPVLKQCNLFILSSLYEGLGLVLLEADTLGLPVFSTDIKGPQGFMRDHGGYLVSPDVEGIYGGMLAFDRGEIPALNLDYEEYNRHSVEQFEQLFEGEA